MKYEKVPETKCLYVLNLLLSYNACMVKLRTLKEWSAAVKARDGKCMVCGAETALVAHHIKPKSQYPELKFDVDNGQTLCVDCHKQHHKENPVKELSVGKVSKVWLKQRVRELERELDWRKGLEERALKALNENAVLKAEIAAMQKRFLKIA